MSRAQLALNVSNIETAVEFYSKMFAQEPTKRRPGYANFAIDEPALKLVLIENDKEAGTLNHLGIEVESTSEVVAATQKFQASGLPTALEDGVECCYALQDKVWVNDPDGASWEVYTVLDDSDAKASGPPVQSGESACCTTAATQLKVGK
jgi:catechol 2,3-dioxygenase-like lactoylglutathione lyase family enzyme